MIRWCLGGEGKEIYVSRDAGPVNDDSHAEEKNADVGEYPVGVGLCGPAVDEETDGDEDGGGDHHGESVFGTTYTVSFF